MPCKVGDAFGLQFELAVKNAGHGPERSKVEWSIVHTVRVGRAWPVPLGVQCERRAVGRRQVRQSNPSRVPGQQGPVRRAMCE